ALPLSERMAGIPLSFAQQRLWFLDRLEPSSTAYNIPASMELTGPLSMKSLEGALHAVVVRHESLRTVFSAEDGEPIQRVLPAVAGQGPSSLPVVDLTGLEMTQREEELHRLASVEATTAFDLERGPVLRARLVRLDRDRHAALLTLHHIASDAWSSGVLMEELGRFYRSLTLGEEAVLPDLPFQYGDYAVWQREFLQGEVLEAQLEYWRNRLQGMSPVLELPTDRPRPAIRSYRGSSVEIRLGKDLSQDLSNLGRGLGATPFMVLLSAFGALLSRYSGQRDLAVGTPVAGRTRLETETLIGFFVNTLVLRLELGRKTRFADLVTQSRELSLEAHQHQHIPFEKLVDELQVERSLSHTPLFQVMLVFQNAPQAGLQLEELTLRPLSSGEASGEGAAMAKFDLTLSLVESAEGLVGSLSYSTELFEGSTMDRMVGHLEKLLWEVLSAPESVLSSISLLSGPERAQLLEEWNPEPVALSGPAVLYERFLTQAARLPKRAAVVYGERSVNYGDLAASTQALAQELISHGVKAESPVALFLERGVELVEGFLGILASGGAYVPLDPSYPAERQAFLLEDCGASVVVTHSSLVSSLPPGEREVILLDEPRRRCPEVSLPQVSGSQLAYVIYTSGSTGRPKGTLIEHRSLSGLAESFSQVLALKGPSETGLRLGLNAPVVFDVSLYQLLHVALGNTLYVLPEVVRRDPSELREFLAKHPLDLLDTTPSQAKVWLSGGALDFFTGHLLVAGEALGPRLWDALRALGSDRFHNAYGPTECTVYASHARLSSAATPTLGQPVPGTRMHVLDENQHLVPAGVVGELFIGGRGLSRGYLGRAALTAERFVPDSFGEVEGDRLYRSGDLGRYRIDGTLEFLGRLDDQVKLRGFRIELGEIEAALSQVAGVEAAAVVLQHLGEDSRLVAHVAVETPGSVSASELRQELSRRLPEYMIPGSFHFLESLPQTPSGKVDRRALPEGVGGAPLGAEFLEPRDGIELELTFIWRDLLGATPDVRDDFFSVGGHSLLAVQLASRIEGHFGRKFPLVAFFKASTVQEQAVLLRAAGDEDVSLGEILVPLQEEGSLPPLYWVHPVGGNVFSYLSLAHHLGPEQPFYAFQSPGLSREKTVLNTVEMMAETYLEELRARQPEGPYHLGGWSMGGLVAFEMARCLEAEGKTVGSLVLIDSHLADGQGIDDFTTLAGFARELGVPVAAWPEVWNEVAHRSPKERLELLHGQALTAGLLPKDFDLERVQRLFEVYEGNERALLQYRPKPYSNEALLLVAKERADTVPDPVPAWRQVVLGGLSVEAVQGSHFTLIQEPQVASLARRVGRFLEEQAKD
nr:amino acid adenylation domain-containing protein [Deltaproteobacteria bacterium]